MKPASMRTEWMRVLRRRRLTKTVTMGVITVLMVAPRVTPPAAGANTADTADSAGRTFSFAGDCTLGGVALAVEGENLTPWIPPEYHDHLWTDPLARPLVFVEGGRCWNTTLDGRRSDPFVFADVLVLLKSGAWYSIGVTSDSVALHSRYSAVGLPRLYVKDMAFVQTATSLTVDVPWQFSAYRVSLTLATEHPPGQDTGRNETWAEGTQGAVRTIFTTSAASKPTAGHGVVSAAPASPLARIIGGTTAGGPALSVTEHFAACVELGTRAEAAGDLCPGPSTSVNGET